MKQFLVLPKTSLCISVLMFSVLLGACGLDSSSDSSSQSSNDVSSDTLVTASFSGSVGDGPVVAATLNIYDRDGSLVRTVISDNTANYSAKVKTKGKAYPLTIEVDGGTDLVTQLAPDFRMISFISHPSEKNININPFTTMIVEAARTMPGGLNDENVAAAGTIVEEKLNFGLNPGVVADAITTKVDDVNIAVFTKSSETMGEMIRRTRDHLMAIGVVGSGDDVVAALAHDIADGELDGLGGSKASIRVAAVSKLISAQVVIEALSNNLKVGDMVATDRMDDAIVATHPLLPRSSTTDSVPLNQELLAQGRDNIKVAQILLPSEEVDAIAAILDTLRAGSLASEVEAVLPADTSKVLDQPVSVAVAATDQQLDVALNGDGTGFPTSPPTDPPLANRAPVLSGTPATTVLEDTAYLYQPSATDADGDTLNFSIQNRPDWASFDTTTGRLSGTPANPHVGTYGNIVVTVSDGNLVDSIGPFSITVTNTNDTPSISGSAATSATAGGFYSFQPSASDPDGDDLTFSITKRPSWASFNINSGRLSGTPANGDAGIYDGIVISVSDGSVSRSLPTFAITVNANLPSNQSPVIRGTPATSVAEDSAYVFQPTASDADGDSLTYSISNRPAWASFNSTTGRLSGTPKNSHVGPYKNILITVSDGAASASIGPFSITVSNTNDAPVISGTPARSVDEGSAYRFQPTASDADGDSLTYSISNRPGWASFNSTSGRLSGTPKNADVGSYSNIKITVSDGTASASVGPFTITVSNTNDAPVISGTPASSVAEDSAYVFQPSASDADGDSLAYSISNRPSWASFNNATGRLSGTPKNGDVGSYNNIAITVSDGTASASVGPFTITVTNINDTPVISGTPASSVAEGSAYVFQPSASDADGDSLTYSISNRPAWASFNSTSGRLSGTPKNGDVGSYNNIAITVSDGTASDSLGPFSITVNNTNDAPVIGGTPLTSVDEGSAYEFMPTVSDPDGDNLTFSIQNRPPWASFNTATGGLSGTPGSGDAATYNNIRISVSDGATSVNLAPFSVTVNGAAPQTGSATVSWVAPVARADGNPLALSEIAGYILYYGESEGDYPNSLQIDDATSTSLTITDLPFGTYYCVMTTKDTEGNESVFSEMVTKVVN